MTPAPAAAPTCPICRNLGPDAPCFAHRPAPQLPVTVEANVISAVESARAAKAPVVGIPIAGGEPFILRRDLLVGSLKGLVVTEAAVQLSLTERRVTNVGVGVSGGYADADGPAPPRYLQVLAEGNGVKAWRRFHPLTRAAAMATLHKWAEHEREKRKRPKGRLTARDRHLARLRKQLAKLMRGRPSNPAISPRWGWHGWNYAQVGRWKADKPARRRLGPLLLAYRAGQLTEDALLTQAATLGHDCWAVGLLRPSLPMQELLRLFDGFHGRQPERYESEWWAPKWGADRLRAFCGNDDRPARDELRAEIAAVLALPATKGKCL